MSKSKISDLHAIAKPLVTVDKQPKYFLDREADTFRYNDKSIERFRTILLLREIGWRK